MDLKVDRSVPSVTPNISSLVSERRSAVIISCLLHVCREREIFCSVGGAQPVCIKFHTAQVKQLLTITASSTTAAVFLSQYTPNS